MSGIYIPGMEMPTRCFACPLCDTDCCGISKGPYIEYREVDIEVANNGRPDWCPLVPVPDHGRLIDADAFIKQKTEQMCENCDRRRGMKDGKLTKRFVYAIGGAPCRACDTGDMLDYVDDFPTIIPAGKDGAE